MKAKETTQEPKKRVLAHKMEDKLSSSSRKKSARNRPAGERPIAKRASTRSSSIRASTH